MENKVFVFGSNLAGRHGKGAAKEALKTYGAIYGCGVGRQGNSYAIPTKDGKLQTLPLKTIRKYYGNFLEHVSLNKEDKFFLTPIGCGLAGYTKDQILNGVIKGWNQGIPNNIYFTKEWNN